MEVSYNARCPAVKRLLKEAQELYAATEEYYAHPLEDNLFEWHFTVRGPPETEFEGGVYHGRIVMPAEYPMKPPNIIFFTPNGRFETNKKICLSISGHHPETWQPSWSIRTALLAIIGFMPTPANGTIGALDYTAAERAALSRKSVDYMCPTCGRVGDLLKERTGMNAALQKEAKEVSAQMVVSGKKEDFPEKIALPSSEKEMEEDSSRQNSPIAEPNLSPSPDESLPSDQDPESPSAGKSVKDTSPSVIPMSVTSSSDAVVSTNSQQDPLPSVVESISSPLNATPSHSPSSPSSRERQFSHQSSVALIANNILLSAAMFLVIALVLRRLFLLETESSEEMEDLLL